MEKPITITIRSTDRKFGATNNFMSEIGLPSCFSLVRDFVVSIKQVIIPIARDGALFDYTKLGWTLNDSAQFVNSSYVEIEIDFGGKPLAFDTSGQSRIRHFEPLGATINLTAVRAPSYGTVVGSATPNEIRWAVARPTQNEIRVRVLGDQGVPATAQYVSGINSSFPEWIMILQLYPVVCSETYS